ncbi:hypothetical protein DLAC_07266 [Tieghemostelium lacteum]|uniref:Uncharacterized protein n=1 Tax=Tieghemostelium lacteum TaxID=361077 RepID=A0A151ZC50_TIELA|nr:hypothetical protein DLAC_07266 [Tieghemostelium lacteum]|eukprot:KYQ91509.1 hypothetical protein DLAC_07266 [Tieghemostelium lacteum]
MKDKVLVLLIFVLLGISVLRIDGISTTLNKDISVYDDELSPILVIPPFSQADTNSTKFVHSGKYSIEFESDFYMVVPVVSNQSFVIDKRYHKSFNFWIYSTVEQQDISVSFIASDKSIHGIPVINPIQPAYSFTHSSYLPVGGWVYVEIPLDFFPDQTYRGIWFLQKHPNNSKIYIDDISITPHKEFTNQFRLYSDGIQGYYIQILESKGVKLYQVEETFKNHTYSLALNIKKNNTLQIEFQRDLKIFNETIDFKFQLNIEKKFEKHQHIQVEFKLPPDVIPDELQILQIPLDGSKDSPCGKVQLAKGKWVSCVIRLPRKTTINAIKFSLSNNTLINGHDIYLDNLLLDFYNNTLGSTFLNNSLSSLSMNQIEQLPQLQAPQLITKSDSDAAKLEFYQADFITTAVNNIISDTIPNINLTSTSNNNSSSNSNSTITVKPLPAGEYFPFQFINNLYVKTVGMTIKWSNNQSAVEPSVTIRSPNSNLDIKGSRLVYQQDFNSSELVRFVGKDQPINILFQNETGVNEFQFLTLNFSREFNDFYLIVGSLDNFEDIFVTSSTSNGTVTNNWDVIASGFLLDLPESDQTALIKYKFARQNVLLTAKKSELGFTPPNNNRNFIILRQRDPIQTLSFSMVSNQSSRVFYSLLSLKLNKE